MQLTAAAPKSSPVEHRQIPTALSLLSIGFLAFGCGEDKASPQSDKEAKPNTEVQKPEQARKNTPQSSANHSKASAKSVDNSAQDEPVQDELPHWTRLHSLRDSLLISDIVGALDAQEALQGRLLLPSAKKGNSSEYPDTEEWVEFSKHLAEQSKATHPELGELSALVGTLGSACSTCHKKYSITYRGQLEDNPPKGQIFKNHMQGHRWAMDQMWIGLTFASDPHWKRGALHLANSPTHLQKLSSYKEKAAHAMELANRTHGGAKEAAEARASERAKHFGHFVETCASCHILEGFKARDKKKIPESPSAP